MCNVVISLKATECKSDVLKHWQNKKYVPPRQNVKKSNMNFVYCFLLRGRAHFKTIYKQLEILPGIRLQNNHLWTTPSPRNFPKECTTRCINKLIFYHVCTPIFSTAQVSTILTKNFSEFKATPDRERCNPRCCRRRRTSWKCVLLHISLWWWKRSASYPFQPSKHQCVFGLQKIVFQEYEELSNLNDVYTQ